MGLFATGLRLIVAGLLAVFLSGGMTVRAQDQGVEATELEPWQSVITSQIEAFRTRDAAAAFSYAGAGFQVAFPSAEAFFNAIVTAGYAPIMESRSHSFGRFQKLGDKAVAQEVKFVGTDQSLYAAIYMLAEEANGWRVQGVQLAKEPGVGI